MKYSVNETSFEVNIRGKGAPILLIHGFPLDHTMWDDQINFLSESSQVIAPDLRGFGRSDVTEGTVSMEQFADDLNLLLDEIGITESVTICGLSMGGYIVWHFIQKYSDRIKSIILCNTRSAADSDEAKTKRKKMVEMVLSGGLPFIADSMIPNLLSENTIKNQKEIVLKLKKIILGAKPEGVVAALKGMAERPDSTSFLSSIQKPVLLIVGEHDKLTPASEMKKMAESIPNAQYKMIECAGHMSPMESPEIVNNEISQFLNNIDSD